MARIVVIEDEDIVLRSLQGMLESGGHDVLAATNGEIGIELCHREKVDLVITDLLMPKKGGIEVIVQIQKDMPGIKVIAISGGGRMGDLNFLEHAEMLGASRSLEKPVTREELLEAVDGVLGGA